MDRIDDETLLGELKHRLEENTIAVANLRSMTLNLEAVNEKLRQSEALKSDFLSNIRNEINNPLTSIMGLAKRIVDRKVDTEALRSMAGVIYHEAFDLDFQLKNIFAAAELEAGDADMSIARVDVAALVRGQVAAFGHKAEERNVKVVVDCSACGTDGQVTFQTDPDKLQKIVANVLANAIEFNLEGKRVMITVAGGEGRLVLTIADEGIGIPDGDRKRVFDRFVQIDSGVRKRHKGHGLGLSITKALVNMLGGSVELTAAEGGGCVVTVELPEMESGMPVDVVSEDGNEFIFESGTEV